MRRLVHFALLLLPALDLLAEPRQITVTHP